MASSKRIAKELGDLTKEPVEGITVEPKEDNIYKWTASLQGPAKSPYAGGVFLVDMDFPIEYPFKSPKVRLNTRIYHPNIDESGSEYSSAPFTVFVPICLLTCDWCDVLTLRCSCLQTFASVSSRARLGSQAPRP